jgi:hypothetical protein
VTTGNFDTMSEQEQRDLARRIADSSNVFDFAKALELVQCSPAAAEKLLRKREERKELFDELARADRRLRITVREVS